MSHDETFYTDCWRELRTYLSFVVREKLSNYEYAEYLMNVMRNIEDEFDKV